MSNKIDNDMIKLKLPTGILLNKEQEKALQKFIGKDKIERLEKLFTKLFKILDINYDDFNKVYLLEDEKLEKLILLEKEYPELGLHGFAKNGYKTDGVSVISLFATITDMLCGRRFAADTDVIDKEKMIMGKITGCSLIDFVSQEKNDNGDN